MLAADGGDIVVAAIAALGVLGGAGFGFMGVVYTVRGQRTRRIVERDPDENANAALNERERRIKAEVERDVWKQIALDAKHHVDELDELE